MTPEEFENMFNSNIKVVYKTVYCTWILQFSEVCLIERWN
jgi:hypothetical protein